MKQHWRTMALTTVENLDFSQNLDGKFQLQSDHFKKFVDK